MTIDERIEKLTERHEALAQTVESLTHDVEILLESQKRADKRINSLYVITLKIGADFAERLRKLEEDI
jgi:archaellum component FlaC